jgi:Extensin-like protein C-terminus
MRRGIVAFSALTLIGLGVTGCGLFRFEQREPWRAQAEEACLAQRLVQNTAYMSRSSPIDGPGACGISYPIKVAALAGGSVGLTNKATLACPIIPNIDAWLNEVVQPAASLYFGTAVVDVKSGSYSCRPRNSRSGAKLSEHSFGNALDVMGFRFADGRQLTVVKGWRGAPEEQQFLREVFVGACQYFNTVLGPGADMFHYDHFHLDLARHDPRGVRRLCKPILKFTSRLDRPDAAGPAATRQPDAWRSPNPQPDIDIEEDSDPFAVSGQAPRQSLGSARPAQPLSSTSPSWSAVPPAPPARAYEARFTQPPPMSAPGLSRITSAPLAPPSAPQLPAPRARGQAYYQEPPSPRPTPAPPVGSARSAPGWSASPPSKNAQAPLPPARVVRPAEPSAPYDPPPPPRRGPVVLQPQPWNGQGIY